MSILLSLETSTDVCSVAVHDGDKCLAEAVIREPQAHAAKLAPSIERVMREAQIGMHDLEAVAVSSGPGSYTGLRIGTSTAKGLCFGLDIPLVSIGTLELLAYQASFMNPQKALLCPMIDARRMEVYALLADADLRIMRAVSAFIVDETTFSELLAEKQVLFLGNGADKCRAVIRHPNAYFLDEVVPLASRLGELAGRKLLAGDVEDLAAFQPFYLKEFVAKKPQGQS